MRQKTYRVWFYRAIYDYALLTYRSLTYLEKCCQTTLPIIDLSHLLQYNPSTVNVLHNFHFVSFFDIFCWIFYPQPPSILTHYLGLSFDSVLILNLKWAWNKWRVKWFTVFLGWLLLLEQNPSQYCATFWSIIPRIIHIR